MRTPGRKPTGLDSACSGMSLASEKIVNTDKQLLVAFVLSAALHAVLFALLVAKRPSAPAPRVFDVDFIPPAPSRAVAPAPQPVEQPSTRQIITPPEAGREQKPKDSRFLSDVDAGAETEQIRRGDSYEAGPVKGLGNGRASQKTEAQPVAPPRPQPQPAPKAQKAGQPKPAEQAPAAVRDAAEAQSAARSAKQLDLTPDFRMLSKLGSQAAKKPSPAAGNAPTDPEPFSRTPGSGARIIGFNGTSDYLPDIPDGDITLLNAKADKYAVFVRRVATQVFNQLRQSGWDTLQARDIQGIRGYAVVRAVLSPQGRLLSVELISSCDSARFDEALRQSVKTGARDPNPPADAIASDGNFRFIFMAKSWVRAHSDPRSGMLGEQRWLLLKSGLE